MPLIESEAPRDPLAPFRSLVSRGERRRRAAARRGDARHGGHATARLRRGWSCSRASTTAPSSSTPTTSSRKGRDLAAEPPRRARLLLGGRRATRCASRAPCAGCSREASADVLPQPAAWRAAVGAGVAAEPRRARRARCSRSAVLELARAYPGRGAAAARLGRLRADARGGSSSGRTARTACTTGCATSAPGGAWRIERLATLN